MFEAINTIKLQSPQANSSITGPSKAQDAAVRNNQSEPRVQAEKKQEEMSPRVSQEMLNQVEQEINSMHTVGLQFSVHEETGRTMIKVIDKDTQKTIREFPPERMLDLAARMEEMLGILFDKKL